MVDSFFVRRETETALRHLGNLNWHRLPDVYEETDRCLRVLSQPGCLRLLFQDLLKNSLLIDLSERLSWGDRIVLFDDPESGFRLRLHNWHDQPAPPHNHRWPFSAAILNGGYFHALYGDVNDLVKRSGERPMEPSHVRFETKGSIYALGSGAVHFTWTYPDTISLIARGPALLEHGTEFDPHTGLVCRHKFGAQNEAPAAHADATMSGDELSDVLRYIERLKLV